MASSPFQPPAHEPKNSPTEGAIRLLKARMFKEAMRVVVAGLALFMASGAAWFSLTLPYSWEGTPKSASVALLLAASGAWMGWASLRDFRGYQAEIERLRG
jgi:hypothetical protein